MGEMAANARETDATEAGIRVRVQYFGGIRAATLVAEEDVDACAASHVGALLGALAERYGAPFFSEVFQEGGALREDLMVVRNGALMRHQELLQCEVKPGDLIALHPIFLGGG